METIRGDGGGSVEPHGFIGEFEHSIDGKNRLVLPSSIRNRLDPDQRLILMPGYETCLYLLTYERWRNKLMSDEFQDDARESRQLRRVFAAMASEVNIDGQGRLVIPGKLKEQAGIDDSVTVVGNFDRVELWDPDEWATHQGNLDMEELAQTVFESS